MGATIMQPPAGFVLDSAPERPSFGQKVLGDLKQRTSNYQTAEGPWAARQLHLLSQGVGLVGDVGASAFGSAFPEITETAQQKLAKGLQAAVNTETGQAAIQKYGQLEKDYPLGMQIAGDVLNIGTTAFGANTGQAIGRGIKTGTDKLGDALLASGKRVAQGKRAAFVQDLVTPKLVGQAKKEAAAKLKEGGDLLRTSSIAPNARDSKLIDVVSKTEVSPWKSKVKNREIIENVSRAEADSLKAKLAARGGAISDDDLLGALADARQSTASASYVRGGKGAGAGAAEDVTNGALDIIQKHPQTAEGMLAARKEFDQWVIAQQGEKMLDPAKDQAVSDAIAKTRQAMNDLIEKNSGGNPILSGVRQSLDKQSALIEATKNINTKLDPAGNNLIQRGIGAVTSQLPQNLADRIGATAGLGAVGLTLGATPAAVLGGLYGATKVAKSATARNLLGSSIKVAGSLAPAIGAVAGASAQQMRPAEQTPPAAPSYQLPEGFQLDAPPQNSGSLGQPMPPQSLKEKIGGAESNNNPNAANPNSTATGIYQFTDPTWKSAVDKWGRKYGIKYSDKNDEKKESILMDYLLKDNARILQNKGIEPSDANLYFAHFMGAPAASKAIQMLGKNAVAARSFPKAAEANPEIFYLTDDNNRVIRPLQPRTIDEVYEIITSKVV